MDFPQLDALSGQYESPFATFLAHTDQRRKANRYLDDLTARLPRRGTFIDAGAGTGDTVAHLAGKFDHTIAIEPNPALRAHLAGNAPTATILDVPILAADPGHQADLVYCGHVLYYIDPDLWQDHIDTLRSWTAPDGECVIALQNPNSDCMVMLREFGGPHYPLPKATKADTTTIPAFIQTDDLTTALDIAAFILGLAPLPVTRDLVEDYLTHRFRSANGYLFSCTQDFHHIR
ncbi:class I SAM-dependent methyltransferase [Actinokineospora terrae]|uniref:Methyltransferase domain-containing protein n=1 Tax=Actinokineospora terrae TaxID=155974 RepID=A0A1H9XHR8_9PSEU|nr:methyltransferase domain-containing protein [Actinokineospora terrae]SES45738.1 Methyltransferase domain-containing protein [Actinokineospora terrae]